VVLPTKRLENKNKDLDHFVREYGSLAQKHDPDRLSNDRMSQTLSSLIKAGLEQNEAAEFSKTLR
jgi:hypothetical protein